MSKLFGRAGRRRPLPLLGAIISAIALMGLVVVPASAQLDRTLWELDGDATNDTTYTKVGVLNAAVSTTATSVQICQAPATLADGTKILIDAERMTLAGGANATGGGCPAGFTNKRNYTATRGVDGTAAGAHSKGEDVSLITTGTPPAPPTGPFAGGDWDQVFDSVSADEDSKCTELGAVECTFQSDGRAMSVFTQAKDYDEISDTSGVWKHRDQSVPDANELDDGMAIKYIDTDGAQHLYFAADRFATNGTKDAGFWFFHDEVKALAQPAPNVDGVFSGVHTAPVDGDGDGFCNPAKGGTPAPLLTGPQTDPRNCSLYDDNDTAGDVLILTTFSGGGATTTIRVFEWIGPPSGSVAALKERGVQGDCVPGAETQTLCATVNKTTIETAWSYSGKGEPANNEVASGGFLEGGVNLTDLGLEGCFSSFMATSRSSAELNADLKDFILGSFEACGVGITTTPTDTEDNPTTEITLGDSIYDHAVVQGTGGGPDPTGDVTFFICAPDELDEPDDGNAETPDDDPNTCDVGGTQVGDPVDLDGGDDTTDARATADSDEFTPDEVGTWCWRGEYSGDDIYGAATDAGVGECFDVIDTSSIVTDQSWVPNDKATVTSTGGSNLTGTLTLTLYDNGTCAPGEEDANILYQESFTISDAASPVTRTTSNGDGSGTGLAADVIFLEADSPVGPLSWQAVFDGDPDSTDSTGPCETTSQFTIDDNDPS